MANYGIEIYNDANENIVNKYRGTFAIDTFYVDSNTPSGSKTYPMKTGETLEVGVSSAADGFGGINIPVVSGGTVSWSNVGRSGMTGIVVVIKKGVL